MPSKKDYEAIAAAVSKARGARHLSRLETLLSLTRDLADYFAKDNPNFNEQTFLRACMSKEEVNHE